MYFKDGSEVVRFLLLKILLSSVVKDNQLQQRLGDGNLVRNLQCLEGQVIIVKYGKRMKKRKHSEEETLPKWNLCATNKFSYHYKLAIDSFCTKGLQVW